MGELQFHEGVFAVSWAGEQVLLLPKEFALLRFLHQNSNRTFTREELLEGVWPLEEPVDRTVDDHVYRLRKKLKRWSHIFKIETIRGRGYRFTWALTQQVVNPLTEDTEYIDSVSKVFSKMQLFGQGEAMRQLYEQQMNLGIRSIPFFPGMVRVLILGDFRWLIETEDVSFADRAWYLLIFYGLIQEDTERGLSYIERALVSNTLTEDAHRELYILNILDFYIWTGRIEQAVRRLEESWERIEREGLSGFVIPVKYMEFQTYFVKGDRERAGQLLAELETLTNQQPYLREQAYLRIAQGIWKLSAGQRAEAVALLEEAGSILQESRFFGIHLLLLRVVLFYLRRHTPDPELEHLYQKQWSEFATEYDFANRAKEIEALLEKHL